MIRWGTSRALDFDLKIEKTLLPIKRSKQNIEEEEEDVVTNMENQHINMNNQRTLQDYAIPTTHNDFSNVIMPMIVANNFEIEPSIIQIIQQNLFEGFSIKDLHTQLLRFSQIR